MIECDFQDVYRVDLSDNVRAADGTWQPLMQVRSARWFRTRLLGLLARPCTLQSSLAALQPDKTAPTDADDMEGGPV